MQALNIFLLCLNLFCLCLAFVFLTRLVTQERHYYQLSIDYQKQLNRLKDETHKWKLKNLKKEL